MASFNNPKVTNPILTDVPEITSLLQILAKRDYTGATDIPVGAERTTDVTGGKQVQRFNGTSWVSIGKLMHDADTLDSYHASKSALPNTIPVYNDSAQLVGGITGNSDTATKLATARTIDIGGIASATEQSFDGSKPITIPINSINVNNEEDTALVGIVSKAHGGTGRDDGAASDIILSNGAKASEYGQIGDAVAKAASVDVDSLVNSGIYHTLVNGGIANNHPVNSTTGGAIVRVYRQSTTIHQVWRSIGEGLEFTRYSTDSGASWSGWKPVGGTSASSLIIYISKSGSDLNTGLDSAYPVLSINRALEIANALYPTNSGSSVTFRVGDGDWGSLDLRSLPYYLVIEDYNATTSGVYSENYPVFSSISLHHSYCELRNIVSTYFYSQKNSAVFLNYYIRAASIRALNFAFVWINTSNLDIVNASNNDCALRSTDNSIITVSASSVLNIIENLSFSDAFLVADRNGTIALNNSSPFNVTSGVSVIGKPYNIYKSADLLLNDALELADIPGNVSGSISFGAKINGIPYGGGSSDSALMADLSWKQVLLKTGGTVTGSIIYKSSVLDNNTVPSNNVGDIPIAFYDKNNKSAGHIYLVDESSGLHTLQIARYGESKDPVFLNISNKNDVKSIGSNAQLFILGASPSDSANSTEVITANWANRNIGSKLAGYLPLTGGTMTGSLFLSSNGKSMAQFYAIIADTYRQVGFSAGEINGIDGAILALNTGLSPYNPGGFNLRARTGNGDAEDKQLIGTRDGQLTWNGLNIARSVNGNNADNAGNIYLPVFIANQSNQIYLPAGGTWNVLYMNWGTDWGVPSVTTLAGGAAVPMGHSRTVVFAIRIS